MSLKSLADPVRIVKAKKGDISLDVQVFSFFKAAKLA
jgi:hypothetical protein